MKIMITGMNGTVAPVLADALQTDGHRIIPWDRSSIPVDDAVSVKKFIGNEKPDWFFHLATGSQEWAELIAGICHAQKIKFLYTSSVSVFAAQQQGPFSIKDIPRPGDDYGRYKLNCERQVQTACSGALIVRLGWQIGTTAGGNHMTAYLDKICQAQGHIAASTNWYPACSFLSDTAAGLVHIMQHFSAGLYHLDSNPGLSFHEIATGLRQMQNAPWIISRDRIPVQNNRLIDKRVPVAPITKWFDR